MNKYSKIIFIVYFSFLVSCKKETIPENDFNASQNFNRTIKLDVIHVYSFSPVLDSVIEGATINIYSDYYDFVLQAYPDATRITDSSGKCEISGLDKDKYYIRAKYSPFTDAEDSVTTPANTTSFVEMIFY